MTTETTTTSYSPSPLQKKSAKDKLIEITRMLHFLETEMYEVEKFGLDWPEEISKYGEEAKVYLGTRSQMVLIRVPLKKYEAGHSGYVIQEPSDFVLNRCYYSLIHDVYDLLDRLIQKSGLIYLEQLLIKFHHLEFLEPFNIFYAPDFRR